ncbi:MAG: type III secretion system inner membrane ring subunit SctD [Parachlamydiaceae bacterium]|nr:type III secretion system inner membrane ring subunit SctD [Parachlamydiaceae bacterium]
MTAESNSEDDIKEKEDNSLLNDGNTSRPEEDTPDNDIDTPKDNEEMDTIFDEENKDRNFLAEINFDVIDAGRWLLKVIGGPNNGAEFSMHSASAYVIGTDPNSCDIIFHDTSVSRQHARVSITPDDILTIEDLKSRNGTLLDGEKIKTRSTLPPNAIVTIGTTSFTVYDREGEMQTIISPFLPAIVKSLQAEELKQAAPPPPPAREEVKSQPNDEAKELSSSLEMKSAEKSVHNLGAFIVLGIITALFVIIGIGTATLFRGEPIVKQQEVDAVELIQKALEPFPSVKPFFNKSTGVLQLTGDVLTLADKNKILYSLQGFNFVKDVDSSGIIIDEYAWREINQALAKNPTWKGITVYAAAPGKFILSGYLQTRKQSAQLSEYLAANFMYLDRLENRVVVEEELINSASTYLQNASLPQVAVQVANGEITLTGTIPPAKKPQLEGILEDIKKIDGVRGVRNFVTQSGPEASMVNISDKYSVTGFSRQGSTYSVVIQGHIISVGDELDGMTIKKITSNGIFLERDNVQYRIDFSK